MIIDLQTEVQTLEFKAGDTILSFKTDDEGIERFEKSYKKLDDLKEENTMKVRKQAGKSFVDSVFGSGSYDKLYVSCGNSSALVFGAIAKISFSIKKSVERQILEGDDELYSEFLKAKESNGTS